MIAMPKADLDYATVFFRKQGSSYASYKNKPLLVRFTVTQLQVLFKDGYGFAFGHNTILKYVLNVIKIAFYSLCCKQPRASSIKRCWGNWTGGLQMLGTVRLINHITGELCF